MKLLVLFYANLYRLGFVLFCLTILSGEVYTQKKAKNNQEKKAVPVILIHGIGGSDLDYRPAGKRGLWRNGFPNDVLIKFPGAPQNLQFDQNGKPREDSISPHIKAIKFYDAPGKDISDLSKFLLKNGYQQNLLFEFYYDFRYSVIHNASVLSQFINRVKLQTRSPLVDIVAHSMGGLIAKQYLLEDKTHSLSIRNLVFVGTPHLGAPKALKVLRYGDNLDVFLIDECKMKRAAHNLPSLFNLLPGRLYFEVNGDGYFKDAADIDGDGIRQVLNFEQTIYNLKNGKETRCPLNPEIDAPPFDRLSSALIDKHLVKFTDEQANWRKPANLNVFMIAGYGIPTLKMITEEETRVVYTYTTEGDGTVPLQSAETAEADEIYYVDLTRLKTNHSQMIGDERIAFQIYKLLQYGAGVYADGIQTERLDSKKFKESIKFGK